MPPMSSLARIDVHEAPHRQSRGDRLPGDAHRAPARHPYRRGLFRRGPRRAARRDGRRGVAARSRGRGAELPRRRAGDRGGEGGGRGRGASRVRIPGRESRVRRRLRCRRPRLRRSAGRRGSGHGAEGRGEARDGGRGRTRRSRLPRGRPGPATLHARAREIGFPVLVKAVAGGGGKGLRARRCRGRIRGGARRRAARGPVQFRQRPGADRALHRATAPRRGAGVRRRPRQRGASLRAGLARCSAVTRRWSRRPRRRACPRRCARRWARRRWPRPRPSAIAGRARWSSSPTPRKGCARTASGSWR